MRTLDPQSLTQHVDRLYRAAWALCGSREDAEDLVQETFARVLARPRVLSGDDELYYLMRVLRNTFLTSRRTASRRPVTVADARGCRRGRPTAAGPARAGARDAGALRDDRGAAGGSPARPGGDRRARPLLPEAARALRVREATITTRLFRARKQVARLLDPELDPARAHPIPIPHYRPRPRGLAARTGRRREETGRAESYKAGERMTELPTRTEAAGLAELRPSTTSERPSAAPAGRSP